MADLHYIGAAQDIPKIVRFAFSGTWAGGDEVEFTINNKAVRPSAGAATNTPALMAEACREVLMASHHVTDAFTADVSTNVGGYEYGEFRDVTATVVGSDLLLSSTTPGVDFTITSSILTGSGSMVQTTTQSATGSAHPNNVKNYNTGTLPVAGDTVYVGDDHNIQWNLDTVADGVIWKFTDTHTGIVGLPEINETHGSYPYPDYRTRRLLIDPVAATSTSKSSVAGSGDYYLDFGSNVPTSQSLIVNGKTITVNNSPKTTLVDIAGGKLLDLTCYGGKIVAGGSAIETAVEINSFEAYGSNTTVDLGMNVTYTNIADNITIQSATVSISSLCDGANNVILLHSGTLICHDTAAVNDIRSYGGRVDWRGTAFNNYTSYSTGEFDASLCQSCTAGEPIELFKGSVYRDPVNVINQAIDLNGCVPDEVTLDLRRNLRYTLGSPGSAVIG